MDGVDTFGSAQIVFQLRQFKCHSRSKFVLHHDAFLELELERERVMITGVVDARVAHFLHDVLVLGDVKGTDNFERLLVAEAVINCALDHAQAFDFAEFHGGDELFAFFGAFGAPFVEASRAVVNAFISEETQRWTVRFIIIVAGNYDAFALTNPLFELF